LGKWGRFFAMIGRFFATLCRNLFILDVVQGVAYASRHGVLGATTPEEADHER
jgi:hypothetical protein